MCIDEVSRIIQNEKTDRHIERQKIPFLACYEKKKREPVGHVSYIFFLFFCGACGLISNFLILHLSDYGASSSSTIVTKKPNKKQLKYGTFSRRERKSGPASVVVEFHAFMNIYVHCSSRI